MVKAKFGDKIRAKTDTAMVNEALMKVLCHNVCVLIRAMYTLGITPAPPLELVPRAPRRGGLFYHQDGPVSVNHPRRGGLSSQRAQS